MKILYGIQTTGHGHIVRGRAMVKELIRQGHQVHIILSGPPLKDNWIPDYFENYDHLKGLTYVIENGRINIPKTAKMLDVTQFIYDIVKYEPKDYDLVVTDYEPISSRFAQLNKIPSIGIGHLYAFVHKVPMPTIPNPFHILIMRYFAPANYPIGLHWHHFNAPILPPTIPPDVHNTDSIRKRKIMVYLHFEAMEDIIDLCTPFPEYDFYVYYPVDEAFDQENIHFRPLSRDNFQRDLSDSAGVIANSGFSLSSEAIHLGKKLLAKPVAHQTEQEANASALQELNLGRVMKELDRNMVEEWLNDPAPEPAGYPDSFVDIAEWIGRGNWESTNDLVERLWAQTNHMPSFEPKKLLP
ncbi:MAG: glycosyltransferase family protein [Spirochaetia bacterium]